MSNVIISRSGGNASVSTDNIEGILPIEKGGTGNSTGLAASATILATSRTVQVNLSSTSSASFNGSAGITPGVTGTLAITNGGTGNTTGLAATATTLATSRTVQVNLASTSTASFNGSANITPGVTGTLAITNGGTGNTTGLAATATILATSRTIRTNLASTSTASFNGSANITPGVTGTLPLTNGGTGVTTLAALKTALGIGSMLGIEQGTYTGVGSKTKTISFTNTPIIVLVQSYDDDIASWLWLTYGMSYTVAVRKTEADLPTYVSWTSTSVTISTTNTSYYVIACNYSGVTYKWTSFYYI